MLTPRHNPPAARRAADRGFTLIEMLVVVVIIIGLLSILVPAITAITRVAGMAAEKQFLAAIQIGLQGYQIDFQALPPSDFNTTVDPAPNFIGGVDVTDWDGGEILTQALVGPLNDDNNDGKSHNDGSGNGASDDGAMGFGYRALGKRYGPYLNLEHDNSLHNRTGQQHVMTMVSSQSKTGFLYYRAVPFDTSAASSRQGYTEKVTHTNQDRRIFGRNGRMDTDHNSVIDGSGNPAEYWLNSASDKDVDSFTIELRAAEYLLMSPGPDEQYGDKTSDDNISNPETYQNNLKYDDQYMASK